MVDYFTNKVFIKEMGTMLHCIYFFDLNTQNDYLFREKYSGVNNNMFGELMKQ